MKITPTPRQAECLEFIRSFMAEKVHAPSFEEIAGALKISRQSARKLVLKLEKRKHLVTIQNAQRTITLI